MCAFVPKLLCRVVERDARSPRAHEWVEMMLSLKAQPVTDDGRSFSAVTIFESGGRLRARFGLVPLHGDDRIARPPLGCIV